MTLVTAELRQLLKDRGLGWLLTPNVSPEIIERGKRVLKEIPQDQTAMLLLSLIRDAEEVQRQRQAKVVLGSPLTARGRSV